ncbi:MAG: hypothetical protein FWG74_05400 [Planctomycetes bacterium]|nr:hypothetical protein [Planctomycetota bacterium]
MGKTIINGPVVILRTALVLCCIYLYRSRSDNSVESAQVPNINISSNHGQVAVSYEANMDTWKMLEEWASANEYILGWDDNKKRLITIQSDEFEIYNPSNDPDFLLKREEAVKMAILRGKADILRHGRSEYVNEFLAEPGLDGMAEERDVKEVQVTGGTIQKISAKGTIRGAVVLQQAESWNPTTKEYQMAVLLVWSEQLEQAARSVLTNEATFEQSAVGQASLNDWLDAKDMGTVLGSRQFVDNLGARHFLGIAARPVGRNDMEDNNNRNLADLSAKQMLARLLVSEVDASWEFHPDSTPLGETIENIIYTNPPVVVKGMKPVFRAKARNQLTGQDMHISVWGVIAQEEAINSHKIP